MQIVKNLAPVGKVFTSCVLSPDFATDPRTTGGFFTICRSPVPAL
jgi:hypothetical protein